MGDSTTTSTAVPASSNVTRCCKLYQTETFSQLLGGLRVAACMISDCPPIVNEESVVREAESIVENRSGQSSGCSNCGAGPFESRAQQTAHYKHHWHTHNLRRRLLGKPAITLVAFNAREGKCLQHLLIKEGTHLPNAPNPNVPSTIQLPQPNSIGEHGQLFYMDFDALGTFGFTFDDGSSVSDSESDSENIKGDREVSDLFLAATRHCRAYFTNDNGRVLSVYRCLLHHKKEWIGGDGKGDKWVEACKNLRESGGWAVIMCAGGHFAGGIFRGESGIALKHKTLHSYVTRRGQGKAQGTRDARGNAPRSAGASLRRYNQEQFAQHVQEVLTSWKDDLAACSLILYRAVGPLNKASLFGAGSPLFRQDLRLRTFPFPTRRPSYKEIQRAHDILSTVEIYESFEIFQKTFATNIVSTNNNVSERATGRKTHKTSPQKIDRAKSRETTPRPIPGAVISSEDEAPCYDQSMAPPNWIKTLGKYDKSIKSNVKKNVESDTDNDGTVMESGKIEIDLKNNLQEFDCSVKGKKKKKPRKPKSTNTTTEQNGMLKDNQNNEVPKSKAKTSNSKSSVKVPSMVRKLWDSLKTDETEFKNLLNTWDAPISLEDSINFQDPADGNTLLHKAAVAELPAIITQLLEHGGDPCLKNTLLQTPYCVTGHQETRIAFRLFQGLYPDKHQYAKANIPGPLTLEMIELEKEKKSAQKKIKKQKDKEKQQEKVKTNKFLELNDKQKLSISQEKRCFTCGGKLGTVPFSYEEYKFCDIKCLQSHRNARPLKLSTQ